MIGAALVCASYIRAWTPDQALFHLVSIVCRRLAAVVNVNRYAW